MQDALGADSTDLNRSAQPSSNDLVTDNGLHSFPCISFVPFVQASARRADAPGGDCLPGIFLRRQSATQAVRRIMVAVI